MQTGLRFSLIGGYCPLHSFTDFCMKAKDVVTVNILDISR